MAVESSRSRVVACVYERAAQCTGQQYIRTVVGGTGRWANRSIASTVDHNYILVSINGTNSPFPTTLQIFRSKAMIRPSFVSQKGD